jgi:hypothetical protein
MTKRKITDPDKIILKGVVIGCVDKASGLSSIGIKFCGECDIKPCNVLNNRLFIIRYPK